MARKKNTDFSSFSGFNFETEMQEVFGSYTEFVKNVAEEGLTEAGEYLIQRLQENSPVDTGALKISWDQKTKYKGVRYIGSTRTVRQNNEGKIVEVPILALLEFTSKGHPFVRRTFEDCFVEIFEIMKKHLKGEK